MRYWPFTSTAVTLLAIGGWAVPISAQDTTQAAKPKAVAHDLAGRDQCLMCHTPGVMEAVPDAPADHAKRPNETCLLCHAPGAAIQTTDPPGITHELEAREQCLMCHQPGVMEPVPDAPKSHAGWANTYCTLCHKPAAGASGMRAQLSHPQRTLASMNQRRR